MWTIKIYEVFLTSITPPMVETPGIPWGDFLNSLVSWSPAITLLGIVVGLIVTFNKEKLSNVSGYRGHERDFMASIMEQNERLLAQNKKLVDEKEKKVMLEFELLAIGRGDLIQKVESDFRLQNPS